MSDSEIPFVADETGHRYFLDEEVGDWVDEDGVTLSEAMWLRANRPMPDGARHVGWLDGDCYNTDITNVGVIDD